MALAFVTQSARALDGLTTEPNSLETLVSTPEGTLTAYSEYVWSRNIIGSMLMPEDMPLLLPDTGHFLFPIIDPTRGPVWGHALPMGLHVVTYVIPKGVMMTESALATRTMQNFSVGTTKANSLVVLPPSFLDTDNLKEVILLTRKNVDDLFLTLESARERVGKMFAKGGVPAPVTLPG